MTTLAKPAADLAALSVADLRRELAGGLTRSADALLHVATVWRELERRGEDLTEFKAGLGRTIPLIAAGRLAAEAVVAFIGRPSVLDAIEGLPLARQRELAAGAKVRVLAPADATADEAPLAALTPQTIRLVFADGVERTPGEQRAALAARRPAKAKKPDREYRVVVDRDARTVRVGRMEVGVEEVLAAFTVAAVGRGAVDLGVIRHRGEGVHMASCHLTAEESERLDAVCRAKRLDRGELVRQAVVAMLLL
jgi:hypothetical protein